MTIGELKAAIAPLDDTLECVLVVPTEDADGDFLEQHFALGGVDARLEPDTGDEYAHFAGRELPA